jgi:hypothetical protein
MGNGGAAALEAREVYHADDRGDPVSTFRWFGHGPWEPGYGAAPLPTDGDEGHTRYYDPDHPTLAALGRVVTGADGRR